MHPRQDAGKGGTMKAMGKRERLELLKAARYAHRGLHQKPQIAENSMTAFRRAVLNGYGIELAVHLTADGKLAVLHDSSLKRTCGIDLEIEKIMLRKAQSFPLEAGNDRIPEFDEVLDLVDGMVPLIIELKTAGKNHRQLTDRVMEVLSGYRGSYCVESFNPAVVRYLKQRYPDVVRGQLAGALNKEKKTLSTWEDFLLKNLLVNLAGKPDFVAYRFQDRQERAFSRFKGAKFSWTITSYEDMKICEEMGVTPIFEQFDPKDYERS